MAITYRPGTMDDLRAAYDVFVATERDLEVRMGTAPDQNRWINPDKVESYWQWRRPVFEHLTRTASSFWLAERDGRAIGFARANGHSGVLELAEFFVLPEEQSAGVGNELLSRAFPRSDENRRFLVGTKDIRALVRYLKSGIYPRFPIYYISRVPQVAPIPTDLTWETVGYSAETVSALNAIDTQILEFNRAEDHEFLLRDRGARLFYRDGSLVGYGYFGSGTGPIALLDGADFPAILAQAEAEAAERDDEDFGMFVPLINEHAVDFMLNRGYRIEDFTTFLFSDVPFGRFENYVITSPPFFI